MTTKRMIGESYVDEMWSFVRLLFNVVFRTGCASRILKYNVGKIMSKKSKNAASLVCITDRVWGNAVDNTSWVGFDTDSERLTTR
jgi:hypothetical protein